MKLVEQIESVLELENYNENKLITTISKKLKIKPQHISLVLISLLIFFLMLTSVGQRIVLVILTFLYPAYKSFKALKTEEDHDNKRWLTYWSVFGFIFAFRGITDFILGYFPLYNLFLTSLLFLVYCPLTNWYIYIYDYCFKPLLKTYENSIQKYLDMANDELKDKVLRTKKVIAEKIVGE